MKDVAGLEAQQGDVILIINKACVLNVSSPSLALSTMIVIKNHQQSH